MSIRCFFGRHDWTRIGSAPVTKTVFDSANKVWSREHGVFMPSEVAYDGYMLLLECTRCGTETGLSEFGGHRGKPHTAAYARAFIEDSKKGHIRKGEV